MMMKTIHTTISFIFQPLAVPTYALILLINTDIFTIFPLYWKMVAIIGTFVFTCILPSIPILYLMHKGKIQDFFISAKEERTMPYLFSLLGFVFWISFLWRTLMLPNFFIAMAIGSAISIGLILFINNKWKISSHTCGMGGLLAAVVATSLRFGINPFWVIIAILFISAAVALARIELKAHNYMQVLAGYLLGFGMVLIPALVFK